MVDNGNALEVLVTVDDSEQPTESALAGLEALPARAGTTRRAICAEENFLLFDYGVPIAKTPDF